MKKPLIFIAIALGLISIVAFKTNNKSPMAKDEWVKFRQTTIDSCEYIYFLEAVYGGGGGGICHKANCSNPIHKRKEQIIKE